MTRARKHCCALYTISPLKCKLIERFCAKWVIFISLIWLKQSLQETLVQEAGTAGVKDCSKGNSIGLLGDQSALLMLSLSDPNPSASFLSNTQHGRCCSPNIYHCGISRMPAWFLFGWFSLTASKDEGLPLTPVNMRERERAKKIYRGQIIAVRIVSSVAAVNL